MLKLRRADLGRDSYDSLVTIIINCNELLFKTRSRKHVATEMNENCLLSIYSLIGISTVRHLGA